ncbi:hypothetical protein CK510_14760 [Brunnivagina elsteri CCALA 953]|uniref:Uncharacterized protein n=1 Tax=Brunnivagina elsteri CCALA 953 TaxID=987040 RepID=A0A2A2THT2_9CYAN|nr:hypothetical protein CK510_14760 [Calothrix elsteri CCALA 953]
MGKKPDFLSFALDYVITPRTIWQMFKKPGFSLYQHDYFGNTALPPAMRYAHNIKSYDRKGMWVKLCFIIAGSAVSPIETWFLPLPND